MTWLDYKFSVDLWKRGKPVAPEQMGWCLLNALPSTKNHRHLRKRIMEKIGFSALEAEDSAVQVVNALGELIGSPHFIRLVEWEHNWSNAVQGTKSFDAFVTKVRELAHEAEDEFNIQIPKNLIAVKMLSGRDQVSPQNIDLITQGISMMQEGQMTSKLVEQSIRNHVSTVKVFQKQAKHNHVGYARRVDVFGQPISPVKEEDDLRNKLNGSAGGEDPAHVFAGQGQGQGNSRRQRELEHREKLKAQGKCFKCESTKHLISDCPKKKARLAKRKLEVEAAGGTWRGVGGKSSGSGPGSKVNSYQLCKICQPKS